MLLQFLYVACKSVWIKWWEARLRESTQIAVSNILLPSDLEKHMLCYYHQNYRAEAPSVEWLIFWQSHWMSHTRNWNCCWSPWLDGMSKGLFHLIKCMHHNYGVISGSDACIAEIVCGQQFWVQVSILELNQCISTTIYIGRYDDVANVSYQQNSANTYRQYLLIKVLLCMERWETQVATSYVTLIN